MSDTPQPLKDMIDRPTVTALAEAVAAESDLDLEAFLADVFDNHWPNLALKQRVRHIAATLSSHLPDSYPEALAILIRAADHVTDAGMTAWALCDFVEVFGLDDPDLSIPALERFTVIISAEFAVRPFIERYPNRMIAQHLAWAGNRHPAIRRLASEGIRPRLPWGMALRRLQADPTPIVPILARLRNDPSEDVRRSVANNLNDISKDHPDLVVLVLTSWQDDSLEMATLTKHALRTLLKQGHPAGMALLGFSVNPELETDELSVEPTTVPVGGSTLLRFAATSTGAARQSLMVDYAVEYQNLSGNGSRKVFKGTTTELDPGETFTMRRKISLKPMSTRNILPGPHRVEVYVNGMSAGAVDFEVGR